MNTFMQQQQNRLVETLQFVEETQKILITILKYAQTRKVTRNQVAKEFEKFAQLSEKAKKDGIDNMDMVYSQGRVCIEAFKLLSDVYPELKALK